MSRDQMQDVFPIVFEFKRGEQPTAEKLTGLVKHTDVAFSRMNQAIGDPWDYSYHVDSSTTEYLLSPTNLAINNVARLEGPSDYVSPIGGCWNEKTTEAIVVKLNPGRNSWSLGFPLVKTITDISQTSISDAGATLDVLDWSIDVTISDDTDNVLTTQVAEITLVVADGDFFVDSFRGVITAYSIAETDPIILTINANTFNMFGPGVPWGTHNVIPTWEETSSFCTVAGPTVITATQDSWLLTLPEVVKNSRTLSIAIIETPYPQEADLGAGADVSWYKSDGSTPLAVSGYSSDYRLPQSISGIASVTTLPEGFCQLWDDIGSRFIPLVEFVTLGTTNTLTLLTPTGWLSSGSDRYRLVITGTSLAENVNYLNSVVRSGHYAGLVNIPALSYLPPISHNNLSHRYSGSIPPSGSIDYDEYRLKFTESTLPLNPHSQYLHRYGYHAGDEDGNSANAMRGNLVFTGSDANMSIGTGITSAYSSYGIMFGGGDSTDAYWRNATISLWGMTSDSWTTGYPSRHFPANVPETGMASYSLYEAVYGALTVHPALGSSLYIRGFYDTAPTSSPTYGTTDYERGASIAFDIGNWGEYNHIKVSVPIHDLITYEAANMPADTGQASFATELLITPSLSDKLSPYQIREFRFRGGAYIPGAANKATGSLGVLSGLKTSSGAGEFDAYFTSPGMVGCDFLNIYSNAIFFSDTGDGKRTSFTEQGEDWLQSNDAYPSGIYFVPRDGATSPYFGFVDYDSSLATPTSHVSTSFGYSHGFYYEGTGDIFLTTDGTVDIHSDSDIYIGTSTDSIYTLGIGSYLRMKTDGVSLYMGSTTSGDLTIAKGTGSTGDVVISNGATGGNVSITSVTETTVVGSTHAFIGNGYPTLSGSYLSLAGTIFRLSADADLYIEAFDGTTFIEGATVEMSTSGNITLDSTGGAGGKLYLGNLATTLEGSQISIGGGSTPSTASVSLNGASIVLNPTNASAIEIQNLNTIISPSSVTYSYVIMNKTTKKLYLSATPLT